MPTRHHKRPLPPEFSLPPYTYTPGWTPHPISDPRGHSFERREPAVARFDPEAWIDCEPYVRGLRLFNRGYYWEAHEAWEAAWNSVGRTGPLADFLKGLIKWAAAGVKAREGRPEGIQRHLVRAHALLTSARTGLPDRDSLAGQDLQALLDRLEASIHEDPDFTSATDGRPIVYWNSPLHEPSGSG